MITLSPIAPVRSKPRSSLSSVSSAPRTIGYLRVSTEEQGRSGLGLEAQEISIREACVLLGWELAGIYRDVETGGRDARQGLQCALESLQAGDVLLVKEQSRLGRRFASLALIEELQDRGARVYLSASQRFAAVDLQTGVEGAVAVEERRRIRERTCAALAAKKARGEWVGRVPFGFRIGSDGRLVENAHELGLRERALRLRRQGRSVLAISKLLGVPCSTLQRALNANLRSLKVRYAA